MRKFVKLLSRLENKSGNKWLDFYEDNTYRIPTYYYTCYNGGAGLGAMSLKEAAAKVVEVAKEIGGLKLVNLSNQGETNEA